MKRSLALLLLTASPLLAGTPTEAKAKPDAAAGVILQVAADGSVTTQGRKISRAELPVFLESLAASQKAQPVKLRGDADCPYQTIVEIIDLCRKSGI
ncbi:MAG: biopolymer transporter ExbD [Luteolibacter sp.]